MQEQENQRSQAPVAGTSPALKHTLKREHDLIVAVGDNGEIGLRGDLPWPHITADMCRFRDLTHERVLVVGRHTWESLPAMPDRRFVVVTSDPGSLLDAENVAGALSVEGAVNIAKTQWGVDSVVFAGGVRIYEQALRLNLVRNAHITHVAGKFEHDRVFDVNKALPLFDVAKGVAWVTIGSLQWPTRQKYKLTFKTLRRAG